MYVLKRRLKKERGKVEVVVAVLGRWAVALMSCLVELLDAVSAWVEGWRVRALVNRLI